MLQSRPYRSEWFALLLSAMVTSGPELQLRAKAGSVLLQQPGSVLMPLASVTNKGHAMPGVWAANWGHGVIQA